MLKLPLPSIPTLLHRLKPFGDVKHYLVKSGTEILFITTRLVRETPKNTTQSELHKGSLVLVSMNSLLPIGFYDVGFVPEWKSHLTTNIFFEDNNKTICCFFGSYMWESNHFHIKDKDFYPTVFLNNENVINT